MSLYTMSPLITNMLPAKEYARRTMAFGGSSDQVLLAVTCNETLYTLKRGDQLFGKERDAMLMDKVRISNPQIKRSSIAKNGQVTSIKCNSSFKLERDPKIQDPKIKSNKKISAKLIPHSNSNLQVT